MDLIERQAAISAIENTQCELLPEEWNEITDAIMTVPSAQPEKVDIFPFLTEEEKQQNKWYAEGFSDALKELSTQPEIFSTPSYSVSTGEPVEYVQIIRCKDCKHGMYDVMCKFYWCHGVAHSANWFCADGKRRE